MQTSNEQQQVAAELKACPFCGEPPFIRTGVNAYGRCDTDGCWMHERAATVQLTDPVQVAAWNTRALDAASTKQAGDVAGIRRRIAALRMLMGTTELQRRLVDRDGDWSPSDLFDSIERALADTSGDRGGEDGR